MRAYDPIISVFLTQKFDPPLQPSNLPTPLPQISALPLQPSALNPPPPTSISLQGKCQPLLLPSVYHEHSTLLPEFLIQQGVPPLLPSNVTASLAQISDFPLQQGGPCIQTSALNPPPPISAMLIQQDMLPFQPSSLSRACCSSSSSDLHIDSRERRIPFSAFILAHSFSSTFSLAPSASQASPSAFIRKSSSSSSYFILSSSTRRASSLEFIRVCSSSSALLLYSRERRIPSFNFNHARLCSSDLCLAS